MRAPIAKTKALYCRVSVADRCIDKGILSLVDLSLTQTDVSLSSLIRRLLDSIRPASPNRSHRSGPAPDRSGPSRTTHSAITCRRSTGLAFRISNGVENIVQTKVNRSNLEYPWWLIISLDNSLFSRVGDPGECVQYI